MTLAFIWPIKVKDILSPVSDKHKKVIFENSYTLLILSAAFMQFGCVSGHLIWITRENAN